MAMEDRVLFLEKKQDKMEGDIDRLWKELSTQFREFNRTLHSIDLHLAESNLAALKQEQVEINQRQSDLTTLLGKTVTGNRYRDIAVFGLWAGALGVAHLLKEIMEKLP